MIKEISNYEDLKEVHRGESVKLDYFYQQNNSLRGPETEEGILAGKFSSNNNSYIVFSKVTDPKYTGSTSFVSSHLYEVKKDKIVNMSQCISGFCEERDLEKRLLKDFRYFIKNTPGK